MRIATFPNQDGLLRRLGGLEAVGAGQDFDRAGAAGAVAATSLHLDARPFPGIQERVAGGDHGLQFDGQDDDLDHEWVQGVPPGGDGPDRVRIALAED